VVVVVCLAVWLLDVQPGLQSLPTLLARAIAPECHNLYGHANTQRSTQMHTKIISTRSLKYQAKLPMNRQSGEGGIRRHCDTENPSPIGLQNTSKSFRKYTMTRGHGFEIFEELVGYVANGLADRTWATLEWPLEPRGWTSFCPSSCLPLPCVFPLLEPRGAISSSSFARAT
jgi:hypothetical protein